MTTITTSSPRHHAPAARLAPLLGALLLATACASSEEATVAITGSVFAGPVRGAAVVVRDAAGAVVAGPATTGAAGDFTVAVPESRLSGPLVLEATGGTFTDEATGATTTAGTLRAHAAAGTLAAGSALHLTPQSTVVARLVEAGQPLAAAGDAFEAAFGFRPDPSVAPSNAPVAGADRAPALAALRAGAFSQLALELGVPAASQFALVQALADDLADGELDGQAAGAPLSVAGVALPADLQNRFSAALMAWHASAGNLTGLLVDQIGAPPFARVALTPSYRVEYLAGAMPAAVRKTRFQVRVTDRSSGQPVTGAAVSLLPKMHMSTKSHACPTDPVAEGAGGLYDATIYYVMSSAMADGTSMGVWELGVMVGAERATFYPQVAMAMGDTQFTRLTGPDGSADLIQAMPAPVKRTYQLFNDGLTLMGGQATFQVMISTMDTMMSFPHVSPGATLHDGTGAAFTVGTVQVRVSADGGASWVDATDLGDGHWSAAGLAGLSAGATTALRVELTVDGEVKATQDLSAAHATFNVTPGGMGM